MIKIIKNGRDKVFTGRCYECATDFTFEFEDVTEISVPGAVTELLRKQRFVTCPVCGERVPVILMSEDDWERTPSFGGFPV